MAQEGTAGRVVDDAATIQASWTSPEVFGELVDRHEPALRRFAGVRLGPEAAEDIVAETFLVGFRRRRAYDLDQPSARPWLFGIATRLIAGHRRAERRRLQVLARVSQGPNAHRPDTEQVEERVSAQAMRKSLAAALAALPGRERDVVLLVELAGLSQQETAQVLDIPPATARSRLHRARTRLRAALAPLTNPAGGRRGPSR